MKKSLIALAALATVGAAQAQSSVTVYGTLDIGYTASENNLTVSNGTNTVIKQKNTGNGDGALSSSVIGFRGTEDLGGGMRAMFHLEYDMIDAATGGNGNGPISSTAADGSPVTNRSVASADSINGFGARLSYLGISDAKLGELRLGRQAQSVHSVIAGGLAGGANNIAGQLHSAGYNGAVNSASIRPQHVFVNRAITYVSPTINGVSFQLQTAEQDWNNAGTTSYAKENGGNLQYSAGKFAAGYGLAKSETKSATTAENIKVQTQALSASYDFGVAKVFALRTQRKISDTTTGALSSDTKANQLGVSAPLNPKVTVWASAFDGERDGSSTAAITALSGFATTYADVKGHQVGATYAFSKRTTAYAIYGQQEIKGTNAGSIAGAKIKSDATAVGLRHSF